MSNATCHKERAPSGPSLFQNGNLVFQAHHVGWIVAGFFTAVATIASFWLVNKHLQWYTNKREQRYIVRLLFMVPIYATISFASYLFWNHSTPLLLIRDGYESTVLTSFFYLLLMYLSPHPEEQQAIFMKVGLSRENDRQAIQNGEKPHKWVFPLGFVKWKPADGLYFLQLQKWGVLQYCVIRPLTTLIAVILSYAGLYCESSWSPGWGHVYITVVVSISVTIAMYCLIQLYVPVAKHLAPHKPILKLFAVKAVVFLTFWQATGLSVLTMFGLVKDTQYMTAEDINIGIGALLETFEMMLFAFLHIKAFSYKPYRPFHSPDSKDPPPQRTNRLRALGHAMDFRETFREIWIGWLYIWDRMRGREPRPDFSARRMAHLEEALGRSRPANANPSKVLAERNRKTDTGGEKDPLIKVDVEERVDIGGRRDWLRTGDEHGYSLSPIRREKSEGLEEQILRELERRGFGADDIPPVEIESDPRDKRRQRSWWRGIYDRISQSGDVEQSHLSTSPSQRRHRSKSRRHRHSSQDRADRRLLIHDEFDFDDPPPPSLIRTHRTQKAQSALGLTIAEESEERQDNNLRYTAMDGIPSLHVGKSSLPGQTDVLSLQVTGIPSSTTYPNHSQNLLRPPLQSMRSDSLLGRIFPQSVGHTSSTEHGIPSDSVHSLPSSSADGYTPAKATPRARLLPTIPVIVPETALGTLGQRNISQCLTVRGEAIESPRSLSAEVVHPLTEISGDHAPQSSQMAASGFLHRRESAFHSERLDSPPLSPQSHTTYHTAISTPPTLTPGNRNISHSIPRNISHGMSRPPQEPQEHKSRSRRPRRTSAQVHDPHPRRSRHPTLPVSLTVPAPLASPNNPILPSQPQSTYSRHPRRRMSAPVDHTDHRPLVSQVPVSQRFELVGPSHHRSHRNRDHSSPQATYQLPMDAIGMPQASMAYPSNHSPPRDLRSGDQPSFRWDSMSPTP